MKKRKLYLFGSTELKWYKLGVSFNPEKRVEQFQEFLPFPVSLLGFVEFTYSDGFHAFAAERALQAEYRDYRQRGEWFRDLPVDVVVRKMRKHARMANA